MLNKLLIKMVKRFRYVQDLESRIEQLKAVETRLREEKDKYKYVKCTHTFPENRIMVRVK